MRIEQDMKLDFKDVLIRPKRSTLTSRSEVDISRDYVFPVSYTHLDVYKRQALGIALSEKTTRADVATLIKLIAGVAADIDVFDAQVQQLDAALPPELLRTDAILTHPVFNSYHTDVYKRQVYALSGRDSPRAARSAAQLPADGDRPHRARTGKCVTARRSHSGGRGHDHGAAREQIEIQHFLRR